MKYYLIAGEQSGDLHGSNLMTCLQAKDVQAKFRGFGGDAMCRAGLDLVTHHRDMDFVGLVGLVTYLPTIYIKIRQCKKDILAYQPDVVVLIDYGGFNMRIAKICKKKNIKVFYYISPKVWAWGRSRAHKLKACVDKMFCILPFEKKFYQEFDWEVDYVGNPTLDATRNFKPNMGFVAKYALSTDTHIVALLPGSRKSELNNTIPLLTQLATLYPECQFVVAALRSMPSELYTPFSAHANVTLVMDATYDLLSHAHVAVVTSGTATLETALFGVPQVVFYKANPLEYFLASLLINVKYISLVNLIANKLIVKEYVQGEATVGKLSSELKILIEDNEYRKKMVVGYTKIRQILDVGSASDNAATLMMHYLKA